VKRRLEDPAAFFVCGFVTGKQTVAHQFAQEGCAGIADKEVLPGYQDLLYPLGLVDQVDPLVEDSKVRDGAEAPSGFAEERERTADESQDFPAARAWR
jgi:hypothetical protein